MQYAIYLYTILTIFGFWLALQISKRWKSMIFNTFVLTVSILVLILVVSGIPDDDYMAGNAPINNLLGVSIVALALPLYEQLRQIAKQWKIILSVVTLASLFYIAKEENHQCTGEDCPICACIRQAEQIVKNVGTAVSYSVTAGLIFVRRSGILATGCLCVLCITLVSQKVRLDS